jgi:hypothetical protein
MKMHGTPEYMCDDCGRPLAKNRYYEVPLCDDCIEERMGSPVGSKCAAEGRSTRGTARLTALSRRRLRRPAPIPAPGATEQAWFGVV